MDVEGASRHWGRVIKHCHDLVEVHAKSGGANRGRRTREMALNRAVVVMTVAAWQAVVEDLTLAVLESAEPAPESPLSHASYKLIAAQVKVQIGHFSTPNGEKSRDLLLAVGFGPRGFWTWRSGHKVRLPHETVSEINQWLKVRHAIAHGDEHLPSVGVLEVVRNAGGSLVPAPSLRLKDANDCIRFFTSLTRATGAAVAQHLGVDDPGWD